MKKLTAGLLLTTVLGAFVVSSTTAYAYTSGSEDPMKNNTQEISKADSGSVAVNGWIGTFDPTSPIDPTQPNPPATSSQWVDVTIPTTTLFGSLESDNGKVYSPTYTIKNNSIKGVAISVKDLETVSNPITSGLDLTLTPSTGTAVPLITNGTNLSTVTSMATLASGADLTFTLGGAYSNAYPTVAAGALQPKYTMNLNFAVSE